MVVNYWSLVHNSYDVLIDLGSDGMGSFSIWDFFGMVSFVMGVFGMVSFVLTPAILFLHVC